MNPAPPVTRTRRSVSMAGLRGIGDNAKRSRASGNLRSSLTQRAGQEVGIGLLKAFPERNLGFPAKGGKPRNIDQLSRGPVGLRTVIDDRAPKPDDLRDGLG